MSGLRWVVIGGGAAGCVVAARLSEDPDAEVTLVEAGPEHDPGPEGDDLEQVLRSSARLQLGLQASRVLDRQPYAYAQGFGLGGSSLINGTIGLADPGQPREQHLLPLETVPADDLGPVGSALVAAAPDAGPVPFTRRAGRRVTAAEAYLDPARHRSNLRIVTGAAVSRVLLHGRRAVGAVTAAGDVHGDRVVVCAGAIGTPALLLRSGADTPGIGEGLQDHPSATITLELEPGAIDPACPALSVLLQRAGRQVLPMNRLPIAEPGYGALMTALMEARSTGRVTVAGRDPGAPPQVDLNLLGDPDDLRRLAAAVAETLGLLEHGAFREIVRAAYIDDHGTTAEVLDSEPRIMAWLPDHLGDYHHVTSTCRIGVVTDGRGAVAGYDGLFVCDASLFPQVPSVNPYLPVVMLAERLVRGWRAER